MTDDDRLMIGIQGGEVAAFETLVERHQGPLVGFFFRNTRDMQFSEDLAQETLLRVYNQAWDYLPAGRFRGWMYRIARNLLIDNIRRQSHDALIRAVKRSSNSEDDVLARIAGEVLSPVDRANYRELARLVDELLDQLPEDQRLTFTLHHDGGLTLSEVSDVIGHVAADVEESSALAREKLQQKLRQHGFGSAGEE